ncbi:MAG: hypothetical protein Q9166_004638 [cf. Caloplaca sp. 2 TL-2023]
MDAIATMTACQYFLHNHPSTSAYLYDRKTKSRQRVKTASEHYRSLGDQLNNKVKFTDNLFHLTYTLTPLHITTHLDHHTIPIMVFPHTGSPVSSTPDSISDDDYVKINDKTIEARWDGDQTKYTKPTSYQSAAQAAKHSWHSIQSEPLTTENLMRHTYPLAKDIGELAKDVTAAAAEEVSRAGWRKPSFRTEGSWKTPIDTKENEQSQSDNGWFSWIKGAEKKLRLLKTEQVAIANAFTKGELTIQDAKSEEVERFLVRFREEDKLEDWKYMQAGEKRPGKVYDAREALYWHEEDFEYDPLGTSGAYKRLVKDHDAQALREVEEKWNYAGPSEKDSFTDLRAPRALSSKTGNPSRANHYAPMLNRYIDAAAETNADTTADEGKCLVTEIQRTTGLTVWHSHGRDSSREA